MSERKVLNKYIPPDFDPSKIPKIKKKKTQGVELVKVRLMTPFSMRCETCGEFISKSKKFNAKKEKCLGEEYLGITIFRFYIRCPSCSIEIVFKTDPKNSDYVIERGAKRNFESKRNIRSEMISLEAEKQKIENQNQLEDPIKLIEQKTEQSKKEMDLLNELMDLKSINDLNSNIEIDHIQSIIQNNNSNSNNDNVKVNDNDNDDNKDNQDNIELNKKDIKKKSIGSIGITNINNKKSNSSFLSNSLNSNKKKLNKLNLGIKKKKNL